MNRSEQYKEYMLSHEWDQKRIQRLWIDDYECVMCGKTADEGRLHVHHIHYRTLGNENVMTDLCTLCDECHRKIHRYYNRKR